MQHYPIYKPQTPEMIQKFLATRTHCTLITGGQNSPIQSGFFNPLVEDKKVYLHLHKDDLQLKDLDLNPQAMIIFSDYHGYVPSYAKDTQDSSYATMFYRYVQIRANATLVEIKTESAEIMDRMMKLYQPEGGYLTLSDNPEFYQASLDMIRVISFDIEEITSKWKLGQNRSASEQLVARSFMR